MVKKILKNNLRKDPFDVIIQTLAVVEFGEEVTCDSDFFNMIT